MSAVLELLRVFAADRLPWDPRGKERAGVLARLDQKTAAMGGRDLLTDEQSETETTGLRRRALARSKGIEERRDMLCGNGAAVPHADNDFGLAPIDSYRDRRA